MTIELPVFRLGLAGFSSIQEEELGVALRNVTAGTTLWEPGDADGADAWWINGSRVRSLGGNQVRVDAGRPSGRAIRLHLPEIHRPVAFSQPMSCPDIQPRYSFDPSSWASMNAVLEKFDAWLAPRAAQFCLASHIVEHETALGSGQFEVILDGALLAIVNMQGETGVLPSAGPADFEEALWRRRVEAQAIPEHFARASLAQLMWQYAVRTHRDVLPTRYRTGTLYFRRPPRLPQRMMRDSHLLLMRELACAPASFEALQCRCGLDEERLAQDLAALYLVGAITSNPKRAARRPARLEGPESIRDHGVPSGLDSVPPGEAMGKRAPVHDLTAPAPMGPH